MLSTFTAVQQLNYVEQQPLTATWLITVDHRKMLHYSLMLINSVYSQLLL